jgi:hypothetical protein
VARSLRWATLLHERHRWNRWSLFEGFSLASLCASRYGTTIRLLVLCRSSRSKFAGASSRLAASLYWGRRVLGQGLSAVLLGGGRGVGAFLVSDLRVSHLYG